MSNRIDESTTPTLRGGAEEEDDDDSSLVGQSYNQSQCSNNGGKE